MNPSGQRLEKLNARVSPRYELWVLLFVLGGIGALALDLYFGGPLTAIEQGVAAAIDYRAFPELVPLMLALTYAGSNTFVSFAAAIGALVLLWRQRLRDAVILIVAVYGAILLNPVLKELFERPRPLMVDPVLTPASHSFPSGHAVYATALYGALALAATRHNPSLRRLVMIAAGLLIAVIGLS
ncbi:MAG: phosphatase PAP2 family protein, partial [Burkholderiales bacterium]